jgi:hypothetical protein
MEIIERRLAMIFNEWATRYSKNPDDFDNILGEDGKPAEDYGERCMRYFIKLTAEMDAAGSFPKPINSFFN